MFVDRRGDFRAAEAHVLLPVVDASKCVDIAAEVDVLLRQCHREDASRVVVVCNKIDLNSTHMHHTVSSLPWKTVFTSCVNRTGIADVLDAVKEQVAALCPDEGDDALLSRYRQRTILNDAVSLLEQVQNTSDAALAAEYVREASALIGEISGTIVNEEILDRIFSSFCIGK
uniref:MnmE helical domain-containing protein n=1 Tax=Parascaris equorum TaxID=6256 RepID=A0A914R4B8_PAREQ